MSHWETQGRLAAEHRGDLDREAAREALRSEARSVVRPSTRRRWVVRLDRLVIAPLRRFAGFRAG